MCSIDNCELEVKARGFCSRHLRRFYKYGDPLGKRQLKERIYCQIDGCDKEMIARELCQKHYRRWSLYGDPNIVKKDWSNPVPNGYKMITRHGHPNATTKGIIPEHRWVMSEYLGRALEPHENVHHINGDRKDNRIENLELWSTWQPAGQRIEDKVLYAKEILNLYAPEMLAPEKVRSA